MTTEPLGDPAFEARIERLRAALDESPAPTAGRAGPEPTCDRAATSRRSRPSRARADEPAR